MSRSPEATPQILDAKASPVILKQGLRSRDRIFRLLHWNLQAAADVSAFTLNEGAHLTGRSIRTFGEMFLHLMRGVFTSNPRVNYGKS